LDVRYLARVAPSGECLRGEGLVWLIGAVACLLAATADPISVSSGSGWPHLRCSTTGSCQSTATSEIVKCAVPDSCKCKNPTFAFTPGLTPVLCYSLDTDGCDLFQQEEQRLVVRELQLVVEVRRQLLSTLRHCRLSSPMTHRQTTARPSH